MIGIPERIDFEGKGSVFGGASQNLPAYPKETRMRMFSGSMDDPSDKAFAEDLLTKSLHGSGFLKDPGDIVVLSREGTFDRNGVYHFYLYYMEIPEAEKAEDGVDKKDNS